MRVALAAADLENAPREMVHKLIDDPDSRVRGHLAESDHVPAGLRARLADDPDPEVRATLAQWWTAAPEAVRRVLDPDEEVRRQAAHHPHLPAHLRDRLAEDDSAGVRTARLRPAGHS